MNWLKSLSWRRVLPVGAVAAALLLLGLGVSTLFTPVVRAGNPTIPVTPPPPKPTSTDVSPSPSVSGSPTDSASPSSTTSPTAPTPTTTTYPVPAPSLASSGKYYWSSVAIGAAGSTGTQYDYVVAVETTVRLKANPVATTIADTLNDPRSWTGSGRVRFALITDAKKAGLTLYLASTKTATQLCGSADESAFTCVSGTTVVINAERWAKAMPSYAGKAADYRRFLINHAIGHFLGRKDVTCSKAGTPASVMVQQSRTLGGCTANPWPNA